MVSLSLLLVHLPLVFAIAHERRATTACGQYDSISAGSYSILTDLWGEANATSGSQCTTLDSVNGNDVVWSTTWSWTGGSSVKSFSNVQLNDGIDQQLSAISTMPSTWQWSQSTSGTIVADVAYDLFTSNTTGGASVFEVMVWLANFNAGPISYNYNAEGQPVAVESNLDIAGYTWDLYSGSNGSNGVYSFLPVSGNIDSFSGDIYQFFTYLIDNGYIKSSQYLTTAQAGTEATSGSATLTTSAYSLTIN